MRRILILCPGEWMDPRAGAMEHYMHEVAARLARECNFVAWLCTNYRSGRWFGKVHSNLEFADQIQIARLGPRALYPRMVKLVLARIRKGAAHSMQYDVVLNSVNGRPLDVAALLDIPLVPIVFRLSQDTMGSHDPPGPIIATGESVRRDLIGAGIPENFIVRAPFGAQPADSAQTPPVTEEPSLVAVADSPKCLLRALRILARQGLDLRVELIGPRKIRTRAARVTCHSPANAEEQRTLYSRGWFGYCGEGREWQAPEFAIRGVPIVCPATPHASEYLQDGETGLVHAPGDAAGLAAALMRLAKDEVLRKRLATRARDLAQAQTWDKTASLVLATIDNLCGTHHKLEGP